MDKKTLRNGISGFPDYSPSINIAFEKSKEFFRKISASRGYIPLSLPAVERVEVLAAKGGDVDKEIYGLSRLNKNGGGGMSADIGLRYDLTVPLARYVAKYYNDIVFPYKRYHVGSCWRGERPQDGRFREFIQCDIDVLCDNNSPIFYEFELLDICNSVLEEIGVKNCEIRISNRKLLHGYLEYLKVDDIKTTTRILDKFDKLGELGIVKLLKSEARLSQKVIEQCIKFVSISGTNKDFVDAVRALDCESRIFNEGVSELSDLMELINENDFHDKCIIDCSITRGFDYYTGAVFEIKWVDYPEIGTIAAGGRYDDLASQYINKKVPGVGISMGLSRIYSRLDKLTDEVQSTATIMMVYNTLQNANEIIKAASVLRTRGISVEVYPFNNGLKKQLRYADKKGILYLAFDGNVKNLRTGGQENFDPERWLPTR